MKVLLGIFVALSSSLCIFTVYMMGARELFMATMATILLSSPVALFLLVIASIGYIRRRLKLNLIDREFRQTFGMERIF
jgi:hypothetical protein